MQAPFNTRPARRAAPPVSREISKLLAGLAKKSGAMDPQLAGNWAEIAGPEIAALCRPVRLRSHGKAKALEVAAANGAAAMQLQFKQQLLLQKINAYLGRNAVARILIRQTGKSSLAPNPAAPQWSKPEVTEAPADRPVVPPKDLAGALARMQDLMKAKKRS